MIDTSNNLPVIPSGLGAEQQQGAVQPVRRAGDPVNSQPLPRQVLPLEKKQAEELLQRQERDQSQAHHAQLPLGRRAQRAVAAYTSQQITPERDYVAQVLGINERV